MLDLLGWCHWLEATPMGTSIRESQWLFPAIETVHLIGISMLVGSTSILDLRLLGVSLKKTPIATLTAMVLPWAWIGFTTQLVTGFLLFSAEATQVYTDWVFRIKMLLIAAAGINALAFHLTTNRRATQWENNLVMPMGAKIAGLSSILLWCGVVFAGRWIAFFFQ